MTINLELVPSWRHAWKWFSNWATGLLGVLLAIQQAAPSIESMPGLEAFVQSPAYKTAMLLNVPLILALRLLHQPIKVVDPAPDQPAPTDEGAVNPMTLYDPSAPMPTNLADMMTAFFKEYPGMNDNTKRILNAIPSLVIQTEQAFHGVGNGADKAAAVTSIVAGALPTGDSEGMQRAQLVMNMAVMFYNMVHPLFQKNSAINAAATVLAPKG